MWANFRPVACGPAAQNLIKTCVNGSLPPSVPGSCAGQISPHSNPLATNCYLLACFIQKKPTTKLLAPNTTLSHPLASLGIPGILRVELDNTESPKTGDSVSLGRDVSSVMRIVLRPIAHMKTVLISCLTPHVPFVYVFTTTTVALQPKATAITARQ
jgi:hypothetical protein